MAQAHVLTPAKAFGFVANKAESATPLMAVESGDFAQPTKRQVAAAARRATGGIGRGVPMDRTQAEIIAAMKDGPFKGMSDEEIAQEWTGPKWAFGIIGFIIFGFGFACLLTDFVLAPIAVPYRGYTVTIATAFPFYNLQWSQWNIAIPYHFLVTLIGIAILILLIPAVYDELYMSSMRYGINGYMSVLWILTMVAYGVAAAQTFNMQDLMLIIAVTIGFGMNLIIFLYNFVVDNHSRLKALRVLDLNETMANQTDAGVKEATEKLEGHSGHWRNFYFACTMFIFLAVFYGTYAGTSLQLYGTGNARYWVIITNYLVWAVGTIVMLLLLGMRYTVEFGDSCINLRKFSTFDISNLVVLAALILVLAVSYLVAAVVGQPPY
jgi:hypothetical protein